MPRSLLLYHNIPSPPSASAVDLEDPTVVKMKRRYDQYRLGRAKLPEVAYFCVTALEEKFGGRVSAAKTCRVSKKVIRTVATLASEKGGEDARKAIPEESHRGDYH